MENNLTSRREWLTRGGMRIKRQFSPMTILYFLNFELHEFITYVLNFNNKIITLKDHSLRYSVIKDPIKSWRKQLSREMLEKYPAI
jgi:hypothetical protein